MRYNLNDKWGWLEFKHKCVKIIILLNRQIIYLYKKEIGLSLSKKNYSLEKRIINDKKRGEKHNWESKNLKQRVKWLIKIKKCIKMIHWL